MLKFLGILSWNTCFVLLFIFVFTFSAGIRETLKNTAEFNWLLLFSGFSLMMTFAGLYS